MARLIQRGPTTRRDCFLPPYRPPPRSRQPVGVWLLRSPPGTAQLSSPFGLAEPIVAGPNGPPTVGPPITRAARTVRTTSASSILVAHPAPPDTPGAAPTVQIAGMLVVPVQSSPVATIEPDTSAVASQQAAGAGIGLSEGNRTQPIRARSADPHTGAAGLEVPAAAVQATSPSLDQTVAAAPATPGARHDAAVPPDAGPSAIGTALPSPVLANTPLVATQAVPSSHTALSAREGIAVNRASPDRADSAAPITDLGRASYSTPAHPAVDSATRSRPTSPATAPVPETQPSAQAASGLASEPPAPLSPTPVVHGALVPGEQTARTLAAAEPAKPPDELNAILGTAPSPASIASLSLAEPDVSRPAFPASPALPAAQVAAAVAALPALASLGAGPLTPPRVLSVQLDPEELGRVRIRIDRGGDGPARVDLTVDRPETLQLLLRDQTALHRALDQAGVTPDARVIRFHLADPGTIAPGSTASPSPLPPPATTFAGGFGPGGQASNQSGNQFCGQDRGQAASQPSPGPGFGSGWTPPSNFPIIRTGNRTRVDITA